MSEVVDRLLSALRSSVLKGQGVASRHVIYAQEVAAECARLAVEAVELRKERDAAVAAVCGSGGRTAAEDRDALLEMLRDQGAEIERLKASLSSHVPFQADALGCPVCDGGPNGHTLSCPALGVTSVLELSAAPRDGESASFQERVQPWMTACFGPEISSDRLERADRLVEEALELVQSGGYPRERVTALADYVYGREVGDPAQEVGGVMVTLAAYCLAHGLDMHDAGETELSRIWTKVDEIRAKQATKPTGSALPVTAPDNRADGLISWHDPEDPIGAFIAGDDFPAATLRSGNEVRSRPSTLEGEITDAQVETVARGIAKWLGYSWEGLGEGSVVERGYPVFTHGQFGWAFQGRQGDMLALARELLAGARGPANG